MEKRNRDLRINFQTLTPLWTGDAWGENNSIRPSSLMGSLRFWFYIYSKTYNIKTEKLNEKGVPADNLDEYIKKYNKKYNVKHTFESLLKEESKYLKENECIDNAIKKVLQKIELPVISQIFGCSGWKGQIYIKDYSFKYYKLEKDKKLDFNFLYNKVNTLTLTNSSEFWLSRILFDNKKEIILFNDVEVNLTINKTYLHEFKNFLKFYENKIIIVGGKKSFGFGFCKINSNLDLENVVLPINENLQFKSEQIVIPGLPTDKKISGFNFKHYQRLKEEKNLEIKTLALRQKLLNSSFQHTIRIIFQMFIF